MAISQEDARKERAIKAMQELGLSRRLVSIVLENLLQVYDNHWTLIECEGYRALADAVLEWEEQEMQQTNQEKNKAKVSKLEADINEKGEEKEEDEEGEDDEEEDEEEEDEEGKNDQEEEDEEGEEELFVSEEEEELLEPAIKPQGRPLIIREPDSSFFRAAYEADSSDSEEVFRGDPQASCSNACVVNAEAEYESRVPDDDRKGKRIAVEHFNRRAIRATMRESAGIKRAFREESGSPLKKRRLN